MSKFLLGKIYFYVEILRGCIVRRLFDSKIARFKEKWRSYATRNGASATALGLRRCGGFYERLK
jgi:hypothetical protein